jgi:LysR family glycine cleavage system transcriptional activator
MAPNDSDVSILYGLGDWPGMASWKIQNEELFPVCSPSLLRGRRALKRPSDLRFHTVIRTSSPLVLRDDWPLWLAEAGVAQAKFRDEISCDLLNPIFQLAINGLGVAMGRSAVVQLDLKQKRLVEPFDIRLPSALAYYAVVPEARANSPKIERFTTWLLKEFRKSVDK